MALVKKINKKGRSFKATRTGFWILLVFSEYRTRMMGDINGIGDRVKEDITGAF